MFLVMSLPPQRILYVSYGQSCYILSAVSGMLCRGILELHSRGDLLFSAHGGDLLSFFHSDRGFLVLHCAVPDSLILHASP